MYLCSRYNILNAHYYGKTAYGGLCVALDGVPVLPTAVVDPLKVYELIALAPIAIMDPLRLTRPLGIGDQAPGIGDYGIVFILNCLKEL